jgi:hypothetical protein
MDANKFDGSKFFTIIPSLCVCYALSLVPSDLKRLSLCSKAIRKVLNQEGVKDEILTVLTLWRDVQYDAMFKMIAAHFVAELGLYITFLDDGSVDFPQSIKDALPETDPENDVKSIVTDDQPQILSSGKIDIWSADAISTFRKDAECSSWKKSISCRMLNIPSPNPASPVNGSYYYNTKRLLVEKDAFFDFALAVSKRETGQFMPAPRQFVVGRHGLIESGKPLESLQRFFGERYGDPDAWKVLLMHHDERIIVPNHIQILPRTALDYNLIRMNLDAERWKF